MSKQWVRDIDFATPSKYDEAVPESGLKIAKHRFGEMEGIPLHFHLKFSDYHWDFRGILNFLWMYDIFLWRVPFLKSIILANILVWIWMLR